MADQLDVPVPNTDRQMPAARATALQTLARPKRDWRSVRLRNSEANLAFLGRPTSTPSLDAILDAAIGCFLPAGYNATSISIVAKSAGVAPRTVFYQFASKEALFRAMIDRIWQSLPAIDLDQSPSALADPEVELARIGHAVVAFWAPSVAIGMLRMAIAEEKQFPDLVNSLVRSGLESARSTLIRYLSAVREIGVLTDIDDPILASSQFLGLINETLLWSRVIGSNGNSLTSADQKLIVDEAIATFLSRYSKHRRMTLAEATA